MNFPFFHPSWGEEEKKVYWLLHEKRVNMVINKQSTNDALKMNFILKKDKWHDDAINEADS